MEDRQNGSRPPVAVIGTGPVGLAAAARLVEGGEMPLLFEAGNEVGANVSEWGYVRLFSPWRINVDAAAMRMLEASGWERPPLEELPTGSDLLEQYLKPLASLPEISAGLRLQSRVVGISRRGVDKVRTTGREEVPFILRVRGADRMEYDVESRAVIDASGTWHQPNPLGASGLPALGELEARDVISGGLPDVLGTERRLFADKRVLVVGAGHSAATSLLALTELKRQQPNTELMWAIRSERPRQLIGKGEDDELPARGRLDLAVRSLVEEGRVELIAGFGIKEIRKDIDGLEIIGTGWRGERSVRADRIVNATGFRPDHSIARELRLSLDPALESAAGIAALIDPNVHTCGTVPSHGAGELAHNEHGYYTVGMKSYGRAPTFLLLTGYGQVRSVVAELLGDHGAAKDEATCARDANLIGTKEGSTTGFCCSGGGCTIPLTSKATAH